MPAIVDRFDQRSQDAFFKAVGLSIVRQTPEELIVRGVDGRYERFLAKPGVSYLEAERLRLDGIYRDGVFYEFSTAE